jgi:iron complex outermembrane receptor protein
VQPGLRLLWTPLEQHVFWGAVSRAVRTPSREETALVDNHRNSVVLNNPNLESEKLVAYELGYRFLPRPNLSFDLALFYNDYSSMRTAENLGTINGINYSTYRNNGLGETYGAELGASWRVIDRWRLSASYTALQVQMHLKPGVIDPAFETTEGNTPKNQFQIHSYVDLPWHFELDQGLYYVENLPNQNVDSYFRYDIGLGWRPTSHIEARVSFQNLLEKTHYEQGGGNNPVERGVFAKLTIRF